MKKRLEMTQTECMSESSLDIKLHGGQTRIQTSFQQGKSGLRLGCVQQNMYWRKNVVGIAHVTWTRHLLLNQETLLKMDPWTNHVH